MQVILLKELEGVGKVGDAINVKPGFARNFLLPQQAAIPATPANLDRIKKLQKERAAVENKRIEEAKSQAQKIDAMALTITAKAGEEDKLFGSVTTADIEEALKKQGVEADKRKIVLQEPIKRLGEFTVAVKLHPEVSASLKIQVVAE